MNRGRVTRPCWIAAVVLAWQEYGSYRMKRVVRIFGINSIYCIIEVVEREGVTPKYAPKGNALATGGCTCAGQSCLVGINSIYRINSIDCCEEVRDMLIPFKNVYSGAGPDGVGEGSSTVANWSD